MLSKFAVIFWLFTFVLSWSSLGNQLVGRLAQTHLTNSTQLSIQHFLFDSGGNLSQVSTWADQIRYTCGWRHTAMYHYCETPDHSCNFVMERDCAKKNCAVGAIEKYVNEILENNGFENVRNAIRFLVHIVGDLHQPLHVGWKTTRGGNKIKVKFFGKLTNLHLVWDDEILEKRIEQVGGVEKFVDYLNKKFNETHFWTNCDFFECAREWANESAKIACEYAYKSVENGSELGNEYYNRNFPIVEEQLMKAAVRLAMLFNNSFDIEKIHVDIQSRQFMKTL